MFNPDNYLIVAHLFPRLLAAIYFFAFFGFIFQIRGLIGSNGILPAQEYLGLAKRRRIYLPTLFWFTATDTALVSVTILGAVVSLFVVFGIYPVLLLPVLFVLWVSIYTVGQDFLAFGWESLLLEMTYFAFLMSLTDIPNMFVWISANLLIFRFHFLAGWIKWKMGDPNWRNLLASYYHYQSQPLPNTIAYYMHKLPFWFHKISTGVLFFCELVVPFGIFFGEEVRLLTFFGFFALQFFIWGTGNFAFLNHMTVVMVTLLISDSFLAPLFGAPAAPTPTSWPLDFVLSLLGAGLIFIQVVRIYYEFLPNRTFAKILNKVWPYFLAHSMAIFAHMTTTRYEVVVEGSDDGENWKEYEFRFKPTCLTKRPKRVSPYQPRLDWLAWFLPFANYSYNPWFQRFLERLLEGSPEVLSLLKHNPFPESPPQYVRAKMYVYQFTTAKMKKKTGQWWVREYVSSYSPTLSLSPCPK